MSEKFFTAKLPHNLSGTFFEIRFGRLKKILLRPVANPGAESHMIIIEKWQNRNWQSLRLDLHRLIH